jgi:hypothetical protein
VLVEASEARCVMFIATCDRCFASLQRAIYYERCGERVRLMFDYEAKG